MWKKTEKRTSDTAVCLTVFFIRQSSSPAYQILGLPKQTLQYKLGDEHLSAVESFTYLGVTISSDLRCREQVHNISAKAELWNIRSQDCSFPRLFVPMVELSFSGTNGSWTIRSLDRSFPGIFVPGNE